MPTKGKSFEYELTLALNRCFKEKEIAAIAYRKFNFRFVKQGFDILVDCRGIEYYLAIECKSLTLPGKEGVYFSCCSKDTKGKNQIETEDEFLQLSGRAGILAVELKRTESKAKEVHLIAWPQVWHDYADGEACICLDTILEAPLVEWEHGGYKIKSETIEKVNYLMPATRAANKRIVSQTTTKYAKLKSTDKEKRLIK
jgi:hypothetical protein